MGETPDAFDVVEGVPGVADGVFSSTALVSGCSIKGVPGVADGVFSSTALVSGCSAPPPMGQTEGPRWRAAGHQDGTRPATGPTTHRRSNLST
ncbi:hypothetical protein ACLOJK_018922 [Asimina triloba]